MDNKSQADNLYLILTGVFIASLISCNLIFQKFFEFEVWLPFIGYYTFQQSVGLLVYPITFLMTDIISEIYGMKKANRVVITGLFASLFMLLIVTISNHTAATPWSPVDELTFNKVFGLSGAAVFASMMAYLFAQFIDVRVFHFWKNLTKGKHLWLRNNASTIFSQFIDTFIVLFLLCYLNVIEWNMFSELLINGFLFKVFFAVFDTPIFYLLSWHLKKKFHLRDNVDLSTIQI
jgi:hypothetical protein